MATIFVLIVCLTITGQIYAQEFEDGGTGLQSAMAKIVGENHDENTEESENQPLNSETDDDVSSQKGEKFFEGGKPAGDLKGNGKLAEEEMVESNLNEEKKESVKKLKGSNQDSENAKSEKKGPKIQRGQFKQMAFKKPPNQRLNKNSRFGAAKLNENLKQKKLVAPNRNQKAIQPSRKINMRPPMNGQARGPAKKNNNKKNVNLPNGGKVVYAQLPDSLLMKQVPKFSKQNENQPQPKRKQNVNRQPSLKIPNRKKPVNNNNSNNQRNIKNAWKVMKG